MIKRFLKGILSPKLIRYFSELKNKGKSAEALFTEIYQKNYWGKPQGKNRFFSGTGTSNANTNLYIAFLIGFIKKHQIKNVFEIGCGDFTIMEKVLGQVAVNYVGSDVVKPLINDLNTRNLNKDQNFIFIDAIEDEYPDAELCIIRQVLQHLNNQQIKSILEKTKKFNYVLVTEHLPLNPEVKNGDKNIGGYIRLQNKKASGVYLEENPFNLEIENVISYRNDDLGFDKKNIPAIMRTSLIKNDSLRRNKQKQV
ncbi:hypothetical protein I5M32_07670 [Pedobacter sp. SD-b]|uniref:Methyltransferase domain-containing protein n=1 Tax=Pedobacter segetis TaxID=2793069 RepID=A0ABS1BJB0_9SPHI|nr:hypothetical protein [Pedobacter segetis]MBK0382836.1 hypothetical protein [Pedobacter segetis]